MSWSEIDIEMRRALQLTFGGADRGHWQAGIEAAWPHIWTWWLYAAPLCFSLALAMGLLGHRGVDELREREERRVERRARAERKARKALGAPERRKTVDPTFDLGHHVAMDHVLPRRGNRALMPLSRLKRTSIVMGAPGSGKTVTLNRIAYGVATTSDWQVIVIDAKGDPDTQRRFASSMRHAGRDVHVFPQEGYDAWRGSGREITNRLVQLIDRADEGGGAYYRDLSTNIVRLACTAPDGPPRSSYELLGRLDKTGLLVLWAGRAEAQEIERMRDEHIDACRQRYRSFFDATNGQLDGSWAFEDVDCAYLLLNELLYAEETGKLGRFLVEDFKQYLAARNPQGRQVLLIIDEFSAIADGERTARMVEVVRSYGAAVVLAPQSIDGIGRTRGRQPHPQRRAHDPAARDPRSRTGHQGRRDEARHRMEPPARTRTLHRRRLIAHAAPMARRPQRGPAPFTGDVHRDRQRPRREAARRAATACRRPA
jgi:hypothetical protein